MRKERRANERVFSSFGTYEGKMCDACFERNREENEEAKADREISKTEEIFGSEEACWRYK